MSVRPGGAAATSPHLDLVGVALLAFAAAALPAALLASQARGGDAMVVAAWGQAAVFAGMLGAAVAWRRSRDDSSGAGRLGAACGALFAVVAAVGVLLAKTLTLAPLGLAGPFLLAAAAGVLAGVALAAALLVNEMRCGYYTSAYLAGAAAVGAVWLSGADRFQSALALPLVGGTAALGALLLSRGRAGLGAAWLAGIALAGSFAPLVLARLGWPLPDLTAGGRAGPLAEATIGSLRLPLAYACALLVVLAPSAFIAGMHRDQRLGLARLHLMSLSWAIAASLLVWPIVRGQTQGIFSPGLAQVWMALGAIIGGMAADGWPIGRPALTRICWGSAGGAAICLAVGLVAAWPGLPLPVRAGVAILLLVAAGLLLSLALPTVARTGTLVAPVHAVWLWASAGLAAMALLGYLPADMGMLALQPANLHTTGAALLALVIFLAVTSEISLQWGWTAEARRWLRREWEARGAGAAVLSAVTRRPPSYPLWLRALRVLTYLGYAPWWVASPLPRGLWSVVHALGTTLGGVIGRGVASAFDMVLGRSVRTSAQQVHREEVEAAVSLAPEEEEPAQSRGEWEARRLRRARRSRLSRPLTLLSQAVEAVLLPLSRLWPWRRKAAESAAERPAAAGEPEAETETLTIGTPPDIVPGRAEAAEDLRYQALLRRAADSWWRRWLRWLLVRLVGSGVRQRLAPDSPEPWDEALFRAEIVGPRGRRFEMVGLLWKSRRRCGCVVTIPLLAGRAEKAVEVNIRHRDLRDLVRTESASSGLKKMLLRAAFGMAVVDLNNGLEASRTFVCESPRQDLLEPHQQRPCELQEELAGSGYRCRQPLPEDREQGGTTLSACNHCSFPEAWERCTNLELMGTSGYADDEGQVRRRAHLLCRLTGKPVQVEECLHSDCFSPSVITRIISLDYRRTR